MNVRNSTFRRFGWAAPWRRNSIFRRFGFFGRLLGFLDGRKSIRHFEGSTSLGGSLLDISKVRILRNIFFHFSTKRTVQVGASKWQTSNGSLRLLYRTGMLRPKRGICRLRRSSTLRSKWICYQTPRNLEVSVTGLGRIRLPDS
ncbi:hypothetical protein RIR_jg25979.t1 [Rhizophagus irregularis DAOM 181602=DAOM 197198]|nr:hypothetical protein RIR_jg25979.t1 [Rhizophagus irregularis DAOM 181602=DAOM 197198]